MIRNVPGVSGIFVEEVSGLPQIQVKYNHERMAAYGVTVDEINRILETTFAGATTGAVYEGDKNLTSFCVLILRSATYSRFSRSVFRWLVARAFRFPSWLMWFTNRLRLRFLMRMAPAAST